MTDELLNGIIAAITGAISGGLVNWLLELRREHREDKKEKKKEEKDAFEKRPELEIVEYKSDLSGVKKTKKKCDINIFLTKIEKVSIENDIVTASYNKDYFDEDKWCSVEYTFRNAGKTDIKCINPICMYKKDTILCDISNAQEVLEQGSLSYSVWYDRKIHVGQTFSMRVYFHKECIVAGNMSAIMAMGMEDSNGLFWLQPLFVPDEKIYDAFRLSYKEYRECILPIQAIKRQER